MTKSHLIATNDKASLVFDSFTSTYSFDPCGIYCLVTGKQIGLTHTDEWLAIVDSLPDADPADCADDLALRLLASMRPSMRWNKMRVESLDQLRQSAPAETLAYLLNRLATPTAKHFDFIPVYRERINCFKFVSTLPLDDNFTKSIHVLLTIDAKLGLNTVDFQLDCDFYQSIDSTGMLLLILEGVLAKLESKIKHAADMAIYNQANPLARMAFVKSFLESKPPTKTHTRLLHKAEDFRFFDEIFAGLSGGSTSPEVAVGMAKQAKEPAPTLKSTTMPAWGKAKVEPIA